MGKSLDLPATRPPGHSSADVEEFVAELRKESQRLTNARQMALEVRWEVVHRMLCEVIDKADGLAGQIEDWDFDDER